jgi:hypothetical protein
MGGVLRLVKIDKGKKKAKLSKRQNSNLMYRSFKPQIGTQSDTGRKTGKTTLHVLGDSV